MVMNANDEGVSQGYLCMSPEIMIEVQQPIRGSALQDHQPTPNNSLQRTR